MEINKFLITLIVFNLIGSNLSVNIVVNVIKKFTENSSVTEEDDHYVDDDENITDTLLNPLTWFQSKETSTFSTYNPDVDLNTCEIAIRHGYTSEAHTVKTIDGYLLTLHRIPCGRQGCGTKRGSGQPVFLQHGLLASSADWVISGVDRALAFILADKGYDVWLGNSRGNTYSKRHVTLKPYDPKYWDFSWHEMALYDLPAEIDYLYNVKSMESTDDNKKNNLIYIGHSMGTTMLFTLLSTVPEYNTKIKAGFALAPVAFMKNVKSPIRLLAPFSNDIQLIARFLGANEFLPQSWLLKFLSKYGCELIVSEKYICENIIFILSGFDKAQFNETLLPVIFGHTPAGTSTKTVVHFAQEIHDDGNYQYYDYGSKENQEKYGQKEPPIYNLKNITSPIGLFYAKNDWLAGPQDVAKLFDELHSTSIGLFEIPYDNFNHVDFLWGIDAPHLVYDKLLSLMLNYT